MLEGFQAFGLLGVWFWDLRLLGGHRYLKNLVTWRFGRCLRVGFSCSSTVCMYIFQEHEN